MFYLFIIHTVKIIITKETGSYFLFIILTSKLVIQDVFFVIRNEKYCLLYVGMTKIDDNSLYKYIRVIPY